MRKELPRAVGPLKRLGGFIPLETRWGLGEQAVC